MKSKAKILLEEAAGFLNKCWTYCRVPAYFIMSIIAAFFTAYAASYATETIYMWIISAYHWLEHTMGQTSVVADASPSRGKLFAGLTIGAAVIVTWFKEVIQKVGAVWPWKDADAKKISEAWIAIFASGIGLFISAFAVEKSASESNEIALKEVALTFDGVSLPPFDVTPTQGIVRFYIPFYEEAGYGALASDTDAAINVPSEFVPFLQGMGAVLQNCASSDEEVMLTIKGFASVSKWYAIESDTDPRKISEIKSILKARHSYEREGVLTEEGLERKANQFMLSRTNIEKLAQEELKSSTKSNTPWPDAFNLWLAQKRRDAVVAVMGVGDIPEPKIKLIREKWPSYDAMRTALAIDDVASVQRGTTGGLLSRSVEVIINKAGSCEKRILRNGAMMTIAR